MFVVEYFKKRLVISQSPSDEGTADTDQPQTDHVMETSDMYIPTQVASRFYSWTVGFSFQVYDVASGIWNKDAFVLWKNRYHKQNVSSSRNVLTEPSFFSDRAQDPAQKSHDYDPQLPLAAFVNESFIITLVSGHYHDKSTFF